MDDETEVQLKKICCTCLSIDRQLVQLCKINNGVNNLYFLLSYDPEAYKEGFFKDLASLHVCWECRALIRRVVCFSLQACAAQKQLSCPKTKHFKSLTKLSTHHKTSYDAVIRSTLNSSDDNFVDCNAVDVKNEIDDEDMPLSQLHCTDEKDRESDNNHRENNSANQNQVSTMEYKDDYSDEDFITDNNIKLIKGRHKTKSAKQKIKKRSEYYKTVLMSEKEMLDSRERKKLDAAFSEAVNKCESCLETFKDQNELQEHTVSKHSLSVKTVVKTSKMRKGVALVDEPSSHGYQCTECDSYFENKNQRWKHTQRVHREGFRCHSCGKRFAFKHSLSRHEQIHSHGQPPREECPICHKMIRVDLLKIHSQIHSDREKFSCAACNKTFVSRASYQHHLKYTMSHSNADILKYKCSMCDKGYRSRGELRDHENYQHKGQTKHQCPICGKALATRRCITRHVRRAHDGVKESARDKMCQQCGKAFRDKKGLREHESIHTGERPLSCEVCGCSFRQSASLYTHRKRVHKIHAPRKLVHLLEER
ncbi:hypothetical protein O0L34_g10764 [Tuta absoluta]|nr:hypothetical protein O0L34_g10764 [Tuta absoluta]